MNVLVFYLAIVNRVLRHCHFGWHDGCIVSTVYEPVHMVLILIVAGLNTIFFRKIVNIFLLLSFPYVLGAEKNHLIEIVLLNIHNICFGREIRKSNFRNALLTKGLLIVKCIGEQ